MAKLAIPLAPPHSGRSPDFFRVGDPVWAIYCQGPRRDPCVFPATVRHTAPLCVQYEDGGWEMINDANRLKMRQATENENDAPAAWPHNRFTSATYKQCPSFLWETPLPHTKTKLGQSSESEWAYTLSHRSKHSRAAPKMFRGRTKTPKTQDMETAHTATKRPLSAKG